MEPVSGASAACKGPGGTAHGIQAICSVATAKRGVVLMKRVALTSCLLVFVALALSVSRLAMTLAAPPAVNLSAASKNFGNVSVGTISAIQNLTLKNNQNTPVTFTISITTSEFTQTNNCGGTLAARAQCRIDVRFAPATTGTRTATLVVANSTGTLASATLTGVGTLPVAIAPTSLSFGSQLVGTTSTAKTLSITNNQSTTLTGISSSISGDFARTSGCGTTLGAGATCTITVTFTPTVAGARTGQLTLMHSAVTSPQTVPLSGTGATPGLVSISVTPVNPSAALGTSQQFIATGVYNNNTTQNLTESVTWGSSAPGVATVSNSAGTRGLASTLAQGSATITATAGGITGSTTLTVTAPALVSLQVTPISPSIALGRSQQFTATGTFTDGSSLDLTASVTWASGTPATATISTGGLATSVAEGTTQITASLASISESTTLTVTAATLLSIDVTPLTPSIALGTSRQFAATGTYTNGSTQNLTALVAWSSSAPTVATISGTGLATSLDVGSTVISATSDGITGSTTLDVTQAALVSISVTPLNTTLAKGLTRAFTATGHFTDGTSQDLTSAATWSSSAPAVATVSSTGVATALATGVTTISATAGTIAGQTTLTVGPATLVSIEVTPLAPSIPLGTSQQYVATGTYTDGSTQDLSASVTWTSSDTTVATINATGLAISMATGTTTIAATSGTVSNSTTLTVSPAALRTIAITPAIPSIPLGATRQFTATGTFTDGTIQTITDAVAWTSSDLTVATISSAAGSEGLASSVGVGTTTIAASAAGVSGSTTLTVTPAVIVAIEITPVLSGGLPNGLSQQLTATATYTDGTTLDVTGTATWASSDPGVVSVTAAGLATATGVGSATVTATRDGAVGSATVNVTAAVLTQISVSPGSASIPLGTTQVFTATGHYSDATTQVLTSSVHWSSSNGAVATLSNAQGTEGVATSHAVGTVTVTATQGGISGTASLTVRAAELVSIQVTPIAPSIPLGRNQQFTATGTFTDGSTQNITTNVEWSTSMATVAVVSNAIGSKGLAESAGIGTATITATFGTITGQTELTVGAPAVVSIAVTPVSASISVGHTQAFTATATYTDGTTGDVTASVSWTSSLTSRATIAASGVATGVSPGSVTITATSGTVQGTASLTVVALPVITSFTASPTAVRQGFSSNLTAVFSNGTATIDNGVGSTSSGVARTVTPSTTTTYTLTVTNSVGTSVTATATVTVHTVQTVAIVPTSATIPVGSQGRFTATATYTDNSTSNVSNQATWSSSDTAVATVNASGLVSAVASGSTTITATFGGVSGTTSVTVTAVSAAAGRFVYAANQSNSSVSGYILDQATGALTGVPGSPVSVSNGALTVASHSSGRFVYVGHSYGVSGFTSNATTGQLTAIPGSNPFFGFAGTFPNPNPSVYGIVIDPTGRFAYTVNNNAQTVSAYHVDTGNGALTPIGSYPTGQCPYSLTVDPTGKFVYVGNTCGSSVGVWAYAIDATSGGLTLVTGSPFGGSYVTAVTAAPNGQVLYAISDNQIRGYTINSATGALTLISGFPVATPSCCTYYTGLTVDPLGRFLYAAASSGGGISAYRIDAVTGTLTAVTGSPFASATGTSTYGLSSDAAGKFLYASRYANTSGNPGTVVAFAINQTTGALTAAPGSPYAAGPGTFAVTTTGAVVTSATLESIAISPAAPTITTSVLGTKRQLVLLGHYSDGTTQFLTESAAWTSSAAAIATISNTAGSKGLVTSTGYGTTTIGASYGGFSTTATLTVEQPALVSVAVTPAAPTIANGTAIQLQAVVTYADNSTQTVTALATWASDNTAVATVSNTSGSRGLTTAVATGTVAITATYNGVPGAASVTVTAVSAAAGRFVYAANQNNSTVSGYLLDQATGALTGVPGSPASVPNGALTVASHPSGRFVYVGHGSGVSGFSSHTTTGQLTAIPGSSPFFGYAGAFPNPSPVVYGIAVDPTGRFAYTVNNNAQTVSAYSVDTGNGALTPIGSYPTGQCPYSLTVDPTGKFVYVGNTCGSSVGVWAYAIDATSGGLTLVTGSPFGGSYVTAVTAAPNGQVLYAISDNQIRGYTINSATGALTLISGFPVATPSCCTYYTGLTVDPLGRFLYAAASSGGGISAYRIDAVTGTLTAVTGSPFASATGTSTYGLSSDAAGKFLYASRYANTSGNPGTVVAFAINQTTGALTAAPGSPYAAGPGTFAVTATGAVVTSATLESIAISPAAPTITTSVLGTKRQLVLLGHYSDGTTQFLTESAAWTSSAAAIATISNTAGSKGLVTSTGYGTTTIGASYGGFSTTATLTVEQPALVSVAVTPAAPTIANGTAIQLQAVVTYADNSTQTVTALATWASDNTAVATVSNTSGSRGLTTAVATGTVAITATYNGVPGAASVTVTAVSAAAGRFVYAANQNNSTVSGYLLDQATGALTGVPGSPASVPNGAITVGSHPNGRFVYVGHNAGVSGFSSHATTGQLTAIPGSSPFFGYAGTFPNPSPYVLGIVVDPTGRFAYTVNNNAQTVSAYSVDTGNGALTPIGSYATGQCPISLTVDPTGRFVYVGNSCGSSVGVWAYAIDASSGGLMLVTGSPFGNSSAIAVTAAPNGQVLYASSGSQIRGYTINSTTGALTPISGFPVSTPSCCTQYTGLTVDPVGRFLYAAHSGSVSAYTINAATGAITAVPGSPFTVAANANTYGLAVDAAGRFLYVSSYANTSPNPGTVVAFAINQTTGALTAAQGSPFAAGAGTSAVTTTGAVVSSATLESIEITPAAPTITTSVLGTKRQLVLLGHYSDGTTQFLTESAAWTSSAAAIATISNTAGSKGLVTSTGYGTTTIGASYGGFSTSTTLTVEQPTLVSIAVTPAAPTIASGTAIQLQAVATYADNSTQTVTTAATWASDNTAVATVSNTSGSHGLTTAVAPGTATITVTYNGVQGTATITVQ